MAGRLMGAETEYAISVFDELAGREVREEGVNRLVSLARRKLVHLPDLGTGMFLENGSRFYVDYGLHPELSTPECADPWELVRYILAGERILGKLAAETETELPGSEVLLSKCNVDYGGGGTTWGCHESYLYHGDTRPIYEDLIPHLVTRVIYAGAGGFNSHVRGINFMLSPRTAHLSSVSSANSTSDRGILHTKDESLSGPGYHRLHLICGESLCSETAMFLKAGTTALVVAMSEAGLNPGRGVRLRDPLKAMHRISNDDTCSAVVETEHRKCLTALEIQYHYLTCAETNLSVPSMPPWAEQVCAQWREMLNLLLDAPHSVATTLDWAIKKRLYEQHAESRGIEWSSLVAWTPLFRELRYAHECSHNYMHPLTAELVLKSGAFKEVLTQRAGYVKDKKLDLRDLDRVRDLESELFEIDFRFGQLGDNGIFSRLDRAGVLTHRLPEIGDIETATHVPPATTRARRRGEAVGKLFGAGDGYRCDWQCVADLARNRVLDLADPFELEERWLDLKEDYSDRAHRFRSLVDCARFVTADPSRI
jgi:hypothetical protein